MIELRRGSAHRNAEGGYVRERRVARALRRRRHDRRQPGRSGGPTILRVAATRRPTPAGPRCARLPPRPANGIHCRSLVDQARELFGVTSISVLQRHDNTWKVLAASGDSPPNTPTEGLSRLLGPDGNTVVAFGDTGPHGHDPELLEAFVDQLSVALTRRRLQEDAATGEAIAEADALRTGILQAVSHDLRTPLAGIKASVSSLLEPDLTFDAADTELFLHTIDTEADRLDRVIGNLLDMGRVQTGTITAITRPTALEEVVSAAMANLGAPAEAVRIEVDPRRSRWSILDGALLERAFANVVANAVVGAALAGSRSGSNRRWSRRPVIVTSCCESSITGRASPRGVGLPPSSPSNVSATGPHRRGSVSDWRSPAGSPRRSAVGWSWTTHPAVGSRSPSACPWRSMTRRARWIRQRTRRPTGRSSGDTRAGRR